MLGLLCASLPVTKVQAKDSKEISEKITKAVELSNAVTEVERRFGRHAEARKQYVGQVNNLVSRVKSWQEATLDWTTDWFEVFAWADLDEPVDFSEFERTLNDLVAKQHLKFDELAQNSNHLRERLAQVRELLDHGKFPGKKTALRSYRPVYDAFEDLEKDLVKKLSFVSTTLDSRLDEIGRVNGISTRVVLGHLKKALIEKKSYPTRESLNRVKSLLSERERVDPIVAKVLRAEAAASKAALHLHLFGLERIAKDSRALCAKGKKQLEDLEGAGSQTIDATQRLTALCDSIEQHYDSLTSIGFAPADLVYEMINVEKSELDSLCVNSESPAQECDKLAVVAALDRQAIENMDRDELEFVETEWTKNLKQAREFSM